MCFALFIDIHNYSPTKHLILDYHFWLTDWVTGNKPKSMFMQNNEGHVTTGKSQSEILR